jgi:prepilin-type N-terminal cleavage/methylation domain-containing protein
VSRWLDRSRRRAANGHAGFTLIEIMVAITLVAIAAGGAIPLLIVGMKAANNSKLNTQAKDLAQARMESMRDLAFHVDRQNGPFVDLLDIYYTNVSTTPSTRTRAGETEVGQWVSGSAASPAPSGPFYKVNVASLPGFPTFSQTIDTQFLSALGTAISVPSSTVYDNLTAGSDQPLSTLVGVTVITTWNDHGVTHNYTSYTRISDSRGLTATLTTQGSANFLQVTSGGSAGNTLTAEVAAADATGSFSTGSVAAADVHPLHAQDSSGQSYDVNNVSTTSAQTPPGPQPASAVWAAGSGDCGWVGSGPTQWAGVTAATTGGLPQVPSNVDNNSPPNNQVAAQLLATASGDCGIFGFANQSLAYDPALMLGTDVNSPLVQIGSGNTSGNAVVVSGSAWVNASASTATPHTASSGANTGSAQVIHLFPGATFTGGAGVVKITLSQASISCLSSVTGGVSTPSATGSWTVNISYWKSSDTVGGGGWFDLPQYTWNSATGTGSADPLAAINPSSIVVYQNGSTILHLSDYIGSWSTTRKITENANSGVHQLDGIVSITSQPTRAGDLLSAVGLQIGNLSCVADDSR